jgi:hypothetical protein
MDINHICDGQNHCASGFDEQNCDDNVNRRFHVCITAFSLFTVICLSRALYAPYSASLDSSVVDNASPMKKCAMVTTTVLTVLMNTMIAVIKKLKKFIKFQNTLRIFAFRIRQVVQ